ncbi:MULTISPECIES: hypothetical protein [unclassified Borrelia]|nr:MULTISPECIES: hypothetical protein [unclassified Borrelia]UGQ16145.1 hypothetical protein LSO06_02410 [Borrelia sp. RT5S]UGQ17258.1 hypothetical protein LSO05_02405 [Borrelia sp. RT1S]
MIDLKRYFVVHDVIYRQIKDSFLNSFSFNKRLANLKAHRFFLYLMM